MKITFCSIIITNKTVVCIKINYESCVERCTLITMKLSMVAGRKCEIGIGFMSFMNLRVIHPLHWGNDIF